MALKVYEKLEQGSTEWLQARAGLVTASTVGRLITSRSVSAIEYLCPNCGAAPESPCESKPNKDGETRELKTLHPERADTARALNESVLTVATGDTAQSLRDTLIAERITGHVEPVPVSRAMERGNLDEPYARAAYADSYAPVTEVGFIVNNDHIHSIGYSPDGLVGDDGLIEIKSRDQKIQLRTFLRDEVPAENMAQLQCGLLVTGRKWIDYVSYSGGMPLYVKRVFPDAEWFAVILDAVERFEVNATEVISRYLDAVADKPVTERINHFPEMEITF